MLVQVAMCVEDRMLYLECLLE